MDKIPSYERYFLDNLKQKVKSDKSNFNISDWNNNSENKTNIINSMKDHIFTDTVIIDELNAVKTLQVNQIKILQKLNKILKIESIKELLINAILIHIECYEWYNNVNMLSSFHFSKYSQLVEHCKQNKLIDNLNLFISAVEYLKMSNILAVSSNLAKILSSGQQRDKEFINSILFT